jgi:hypothetical protein
VNGTSSRLPAAGELDGVDEVLVVEDDRQVDLDLLAGRVEGERAEVVVAVVPRLHRKVAGAGVVEDAASGGGELVEHLDGRTTGLGLGPSSAAIVDLGVNLSSRNTDAAGDTDNPLATVSLAAVAATA